MTRSRAKINESNQIKLPKSVCKALGVVEGDLLNLTLVQNVKGLPDGAIVLTPPAKNNKPWTDKEWREKEREASRSIKRGETYGPFDDVEEAIAFLKKHAKLRKPIA